MTSITITLPDDRLLQLQEKAKIFGLPRKSSSGSVSVEELLTRIEDAFQQAVEHVLKKNANCIGG